MSKRIIASACWNLEGIGQIKFRRNIRAKRLTISVRPTTGVRVTIPGLLPFKAAKDFVEIKKEWISQKVNEFEKNRVILSNDSNFCTRNHRLLFSPQQRKNIKVTLTGNEIQVCYPTTSEIADYAVQEAAKHGIVEAYRKEAKQILPERLEQLATQKGFSYNKLSIKNIKSRWGSCSSKNNINLSIYLMKLPDELVDYVILHELTHTIHRNHGKDFWSHLNEITGNAKELAARVKKYRTGI